MAMTSNLLMGQASEWALLKRHPSEDLFGVQLAGSYPDQFTKACQIIKENLKVDFVDINSGCPIDLVFDKGAGCALMTRLDHFHKICTSVDTLLDVPLTVKVRTGIKEDVFIAHELIPQIKNWGVSMITVSLICYITTFINIFISWLNLKVAWKNPSTKIFKARRLELY
jgi:tRNA-dihydrouridine synthase 3